MKREINMRKNNKIKPGEFNFNFKAEMSTEGRINTDPNGSYTGVCTDDVCDIPVQDADDL
jgi:hypothetical protein